MTPRAVVPHVGERLRWCRYDSWFGALCRFARRYGINR